MVHGEAHPPPPGTPLPATSRRTGIEVEGRGAAADEGSDGAPSGQQDAVMTDADTTPEDAPSPLSALPPPPPYAGPSSAAEGTERVKNRRPKTCSQCAQRGLDVAQDAADALWYCFTCLDAYQRGDAPPARTSLPRNRIPIEREPARERVCGVEPTRTPSQDGDMPPSVRGESWRVEPLPVGVYMTHRRADLDIIPVVLCCATTSRALLGFRRRLVCVSLYRRISCSGGAACTPTRRSRWHATLAASLTLRCVFAGEVSGAGREALPSTGGIALLLNTHT